MEEDDLSGASPADLNSLYEKYAAEEATLRKAAEDRIRSRWQQSADTLRQQRIAPSKTARIAEALLAFGAPTRGGGWAALANAGSTLAQRNAQIKDAQEAQRMKLAEFETSREDALAELAQKYDTQRLGLLGKLSTAAQSAGKPKTGFNPVTGDLVYMSGENMGQPVSAGGQRPESRLEIIDGKRYIRDVKGGLTPDKEQLSEDEMLDRTAAKAAAQAEAKKLGEDRAMARTTLGSAKTAAGAAIANIDAMSKHPGKSAVIGLPNPLEGGFGPLGQVPGSPAADFKAKVKQAQGGAFLQAFNALRGGGAITEIEGQKATDAMARLDTAQSEAEFDAALAELRSLLERGVANLEQRANAKLPGEDKPAAKRSSAAPTSLRININKRTAAPVSTPKGDTRPPLSSFKLKE